MTRKDIVARYLIPALALGLGLVPGCGKSKTTASTPPPAASKPRPRSDAKAIQTVFADFTDAVSNNDGQRAVQYVDAKTLRTYEELAYLARMADRSALLSQSTARQVMVILIRQSFDRYQLRPLDGAGLYAKMVDEDAFMAATFKDVALGPVTVEGDKAKAVVTKVGGDPADKTEVQFVREEVWKLDLSGALRALEADLSDMPSEPEARMEAVLDLVGDMLGARPRASLYDGPR